MLVLLEGMQFKEICSNLNFLILILCQWQPVIRVDQGLSFSQWEHRLDDTRPIRKRETRQLAFFSAGDVSGSGSIGVISQLVQRDETFCLWLESRMRTLLLLVNTVDSFSWVGSDVRLDTLSVPTIYLFPHYISKGPTNSLVNFTI